MKNFFVRVWVWKWRYDMDCHSDYSVIVKARNQDHAKVVGIENIREVYKDCDFQVIEANPHIDMV